MAADLISIIRNAVYLGVKNLYLITLKWIILRHTLFLRLTKFPIP